jgi:SM-20-related protein
MNINQSKYHQLADNIVEHGFHSLDNFLNPELFFTLRTIAIRLHQEGYYQSARIGNHLNKTQNTSVRSDVICWLDRHSEEKAIMEYLKAIRKISDLLNQTLFLGLHDIEAHFAIYESNQYYKKHRDVFSNNNDRRISCVYYLNDDWQKESGGQLKIYNEDANPLASILPVGNRLVVFKSNLIHEVCAAYRTRCSIATWFKVRPTVQR